jgi:hypothetical protein
MGCRGGRAAPAGRRLAAGSSSLDDAAAIVVRSHDSEQNQNQIHRFFLLSSGSGKSEGSL